ncbi:MAG: alpha/beta hydrolase family protein [Capsulimonadales bacterium]|nr:alpha/beta hydrolase family protein [Capsulimonadales bacterium]
MALCHLNYFSHVLQKQSAAFIIVPETGTPPYPVLYLLHGLSDDYTIWLRQTSVERYVADLPLMVVLADGGRGFYCDAEEGFAYGTAIGVELPERIERTFPAMRTREGRCLAGLSMGGYGATRLALTYPDRFAAAVSHSGAMGFGHFPVGHDARPYPAEFRRILGPTPTGGPNDLFALAENVAPADRPALRIDCGVDDFLIEPNRQFHAHLESIGYPHEYEEFPGAHTWDYWDVHIREAIAFLRGQLLDKTGA